MNVRTARRLAILLFVSVLLSLQIIVRFRYFSLTFLVGGVALGSLLYLARAPAEQHESGSADTEERVTRSRIRAVATCGFFLLTAASLLTLQSHPYEKPLLYYGLVSASAALIAVQIPLLPSGRGVGGILSMVLVLALNLFGSSQLVFPLGIGGADAPLHIFALVDPIVRTGAIPVKSACGFIYGTFPGHHLLVATGSVLLATPTTTTYYGLGALVMTLPLLVAHSVVRSLTTPRLGLLAALVLPGGSYYIFWAVHASTLTFALPLIAAIVLVLLLTWGRKSRRLLLAGTLLAVALILTHPYSSVIFGIILVGLVGAVAVEALREHRVRWPWGTRVLPVGFAYLIVLYWSNFTCLYRKSIGLVDRYHTAIFEEPTVASPGVYDVSVPLSMILVNTLGDALLLMLAVAGAFVLLSHRLPRRPIVVGPTVALVTAATIGLVTPLIYLNPNRIYVFLLVLGFAPLAAVGLFFLTSGRAGWEGVRRRALRATVLAILIGTFVFLSSTSVIAGFETSPHRGDVAHVKLYDTPYEAASSAWICKHADTVNQIRGSRSLFFYERLTVESCLGDHGGRLLRLSTNDNRSLDLSNVKGGSLVWFSRYDLSPGFQAGLIGDENRFGQGALVRLDPGAVDDLASLNRIYDNGQVQIYQRPPGG